MVNQMLETKVAKPYAEALYQLGINSYFEKAKSSDFYDMLFHLQDFLKLLEENPVLKNYLENPLIRAKDKKEVLKKCINSEINTKTLNFLYLLIDKKRINCIESIYKAFLEKANNFLSIKYVEVTSAIALTAEQEETLANTLATLFTSYYKERPIIRLKLNVNPEILGGFVLKSNSKVTDLSILGELRKLGKKLGVSI